MKKTLLLHFFFWSVCSCGAQNLVPNPSFEEHDSCPDNVSEFRFVKDWFQPTSGTTDYYNECDTTPFTITVNAGVPNNALGHQESYTGLGYVGIYLREGTNSYPLQGYREYIEVKLKHSLESHKQYIVSFYYSQADSARIAVKSLGVYFSKDSLLQTGWNYLPVIPQVNYDGDYIMDTSNWLLFTKSFIANGGENFITIGNFKDNAETEFYFWGVPTFSITYISYIYIDDVSLYEDTSITADTTDAFSVQPNLSQSILNIFYSSQNANSPISFEVFNMLGQKIIYSELQTGETTLQTSSWSAGCYIYHAQNSALNQSGKFILTK